MEVKGAALLYTLATLAITFAGFAALLLIIKQSAGGALSSLDRFFARTVVGHFFWLAAGAIFPPLLALYGLAEPLVWKASALLFGLPMLAILLSFPQRRRAATGQPVPHRIFLVMVFAGALAVAVMIALVLANIAEPSAVYATAIVINFLTHVFAFITALEVILMQQPKT
jgi:predicted neutral ceramidase superfamily lipid hydrolase